MTLKKGMILVDPKMNREYEVDKIMKQSIVQLKYFHLDTCVVFTCTLDFAERNFNVK